MAKVLVKHCPKSYKFVASISRDVEAFMDYRTLPNNTMEIYHTEVPSEFRGRGIAKQLCDSAFKYAADNKLKIFPSCSYAEKYAKESGNPEYKGLVTWPKTPYI